MEPDETRTFVNEELRGIRESLDRVGATVEDTLVALEGARAGEGATGGASPALRARRDVLELLRGTSFYTPVADMLNDMVVELGHG